MNLLTCSCASEENQFLPEPDWEVYLKETARMILQQQSAEK